MVFVPFQGIHFFNYKGEENHDKGRKKVFVPFQGIHFFNIFIFTQIMEC